MKKDQRGRFLGNENSERCKSDSGFLYESIASRGQQILWLAHQLDGTKSAYNVHFACEITGELNFAILGRCVRELAIAVEAGR